MNKVVILLDGLGDSSYKQLGNKSPLDAAKTPNLDKLCLRSKLGLMDVIDKNIAPESDEAMLALLGFNPFKYHTGRGPLEAYGADVHFKEGNVVIRCNFVEVKGNFITHIEPELSREKIKYFVKRLNRIDLGVKFRFIDTVGHRAVLILEGGSDKITNSHPGYNIIKNYISSANPVKTGLNIKKCFPLNNNAKETARSINKFVEMSKKILKGYAVVTRGAGDRLPKLKKLKNWVLLADMPVELAIGRLTGMRIVKKTNNYKKDAELIKNLAKKHNVYVQIKGPDASSHHGKFKEKMKSVEKIDKEFIAGLLDMDAEIIVTADHSTECKLKAHSKLPVPLMITGKSDGIKHFSEKNCRKGSIGRINGTDLLRI